MNEKPISIFKIRCYMFFGGIFGIHRFCLNQFAEAFILLSTGGGFLIGLFYDTFSIRGIVQDINNKIINRELLFDKEKQKSTSSLNNFVNNLIFCTMLPFFLQSIYVFWMGFLFVFLKLQLNADDEYRISTSIFIAFGTAFALYIYGNTGGKRRNFFSAWCGTFSMSFLLHAALGITPFQTLFLLSIFGSALNKMFQKMEPINILTKKDETRPLNATNFYLWTAIFIVLVVSLNTVTSETILNVPVKVGFGGNAERVRTLLFNAITGQHATKNRKFFLYGQDVSYMPKLQANKNKHWLIKTKQTRMTSTIIAFIVDYLRTTSYKTTLSHTNNFNINLYPDPFIWTVNRMFLIQTFDGDALLTDKEVSKNCANYRAQANNVKLDKTVKQDFKILNILQCCDIFENLFRKSFMKTN
uniref:TM2 domain-containing protein n=1 Tax=Rhabditophanes sp. KR3021 TaxID=114890 RepID=A0AC35U166_9BILA